MVSYYNIVEGNLRTGDVAKSSDINHIQVHIQDACREMNLDFHDGESYIIGSGDKHKNDFVLTPAPKLLGRYIDDKIYFETDKSKFININRKDVKQPILLTKTSVYSVITKLKNTSNKNIPVEFELQDIGGNVLRSNTLTIPAGTEDTEFEVVFDLSYYPTSFNINRDDIDKRDGKDICKITKEEDYDEGFQHDYEDDKELEQFSVGVSQLYFVIKRTNLNEIDLVDDGKEPVFDPDNDLGVYYTSSSPNPEKNIYCLENSGSSASTFESTGKNIWFKCVYANEQTYLCTGGEAVIGGEKVHCIDTHISIEGGNAYGNILSTVYLGLDGHLYFMNSKASLTTNLENFEEDLDSKMPAFFLPIAAILTYSNMYGIDKDPLIIQSQEDGFRPLSHHERIRRLEKQVDWQEEFSMPSRLKVTWTGKTWLDEEGSSIIDTSKLNDINFDKSKYYITTDAKGNPIIKLSDNVVHNIPITLKETFKGKDGNEISLKEYDILNASYFASLNNIVRDESKGTLIMNKKSAETKTTGVATTTKEAKETKYNPWDDYKGNRPSSSKLKKHEREFEVVAGKNGRNDFQSEFPAMTFYTKSNYKFTKLTIPIYKFKNCSGVKFYIWKRQNPNNKKNTVWLEKKVHTSKEFSLKKAKQKGKYQYMENGFTIKFDNGGLSLPKGQYVIICLPIPKSGEGSVFVETYEPQNPRDFLIRYHGAANASHFLLKSRYPEIWYNPVEATVTEEQYYTKGVATSKSIVWSDSGLEKIETINPVIGEHITIPNKCSYKIFADTGAGWQELTPNTDNIMNGGATTFKWKIEFYGNGKDSPVLKYNTQDGYAIKFILTRTRSSVSNTTEIESLDANMCLTTKPFDADYILRDYVGDNNLGILSNPFNQYEFARIWAERETNQKLLVDIQGADRYIGDSTAPLWTYHYTDLTLDDFNQQNVDYSHYTEEVEYDENNLRLKLDSDHSYNDDDIVISDLKEFTKAANEIDSNKDTTSMTFVNITPTESEDGKKTEISNQLFLKSVFDNYYDLTQYTGLTIKFKTDVTNADTSTVISKLNGLGIYISSVNNLDEVPTNQTILDTISPLENTDVLAPVLYTDSSSLSYYEGQIIKLSHPIDDGNKAYEDCYYQYVADYNQDTNEIVYKLQQIHDIKPYCIYRVGEISFDSSSIVEKTIETDVLDDNGNPIYLDKNGGTVYPLNDKYIYKDTDGNTLVNSNNEIIYADATQVTKKTKTEINRTGEYTVRIEFDLNNQNLKYAREIGIITLNDEDTYSVTGNDPITLEISEVRAISQEYYPIFDPEKNIDSLKSSALNEDYVTIKDYNKLDFTEELFDKEYSEANINDENKISTIRNNHSTNPYTTQISIKYGSINTSVENKLCYMNNEYDLSNYKHLGIQIASDIYLPKDVIKINLCEEANGEGVFASANIPTTNMVFTPTGKSNKYETINLSHIFKKINTDKKIKSISITATDHFNEFISKIVKSDQKGDRINLFIGKIVLYRAETIPMFHKIMRYKLYSTTDGEIDHTESDTVKNTINIRKIGTVIDYS